MDILIDKIKQNKEINIEDITKFVQDNDLPVTSVLNELCNCLVDNNKICKYNIFFLLSKFYDIIVYKTFKNEAIVDYSINGSYYRIILNKKIIKTSILKIPISLIIYKVVTENKYYNLILKNDKSIINKDIVNYSILYKIKNIETVHVEEINNILIVFEDFFKYNVFKIKALNS